MASHHDGIVVLARNFKSEPFHQPGGRAIGSDAQRDGIQIWIGPDELGEERGTDAALTVSRPDDKSQYGGRIFWLALKESSQPDGAEERFLRFFA